MNRNNHNQYKYRKSISNKYKINIFNKLFK